MNETYVLLTVDKALKALRNSLPKQKPMKELNQILLPHL